MLYVLVLLPPNVKARFLLEDDRWSSHVVQHLLSIITIQNTKYTLRSCLLESTHWPTEVSGDVFCWLSDRISLTWNNLENRARAKYLQMNNFYRIHLIFSKYLFSSIRHFLEKFTVILNGLSGMIHCHASSFLNIIFLHLYRKLIEMNWNTKVRRQMRENS